MRLPEPWYYPLQDVAEGRWHVPVDRVLHYIDTGYCQPSALIHKAMLGLDLPGPSPYVVVQLHAYRDMIWTDSTAGRIADLVLPCTAYEYDRGEVRSIQIERLDGPVLVARADLVLSLSAIEEVERAVSEPRNINPTERTTLLQIMAVLLDEDNDRWREHPYECASWIRQRLSNCGKRLSNETIAQKVRAAGEAIASVREDEPVSA